MSCLESGRRMVFTLRLFCTVVDATRLRGRTSDRQPCLLHGWRSGKTGQP